VTNRLAIISFLVLLFQAHFLAQVTTNPNSANTCSCDGSLTFNSLPLSADYTLYDDSNTQLTNGTNPVGSFSINGLCPGVYSLEVIQNSDTSVFYLNIPTVVIDPGESTFESICSTDGSVNLNSLINGIAPGGSWTSPSGINQPLMPINAEFMEEGWYTYSIPSGGCSVITGVFIDFIQNADPGLTTTYEICETYVPFAMIDFMQGDPDPGGQWFDANGNMIDGFYYPATMNSGLYTYVIDTVAGCGPVFRTMNIDENVQPFAGVDTQISVCENGIPFNMFTQFTGNPDNGGQWTSPQNTPVSSTFNPATYTEGVYRYLITANAPCIADQALLTITFLDDDPSGESHAINLCENEPNADMLAALNGNPTAGGIWTNANGQIVDGIFDPGAETPGTYNYVFPNVGCSPDGSDLSISVENLNNAGNDNNALTCITAGQLNLNSFLTLGAELGGLWTNISGQPVSNLFSPSAGTGAYSFNYIISGGLCPSDASVITVNVQDAPPPPSDYFIEMCEDDVPLSMSALYPAIPDIFFENSSGTVIDDLFNPQSGSTIVYAVVPSGNGCPDSEGIIEFQVNYPVFASDSIEIDVCNSLGTFDLDDLLSAQALGNGIWFDENNIALDGLLPLSEEGVYTYRYILDQTPLCGNDNLIAVLSVSEPLDAGPGESFIFCSNDPSVALTTLLPASSSGIGTWSLNGLPFSDSQIDPATAISGDYFFIVPQNGSCPSDFAILNIAIQQAINFSAGPDVSVCAGSMPFQIGQAESTGSIYSWTPSTNLSAADVSNPTINVSDDISESTTITYTVLVNDQTCSYQDEITVTTHPLPMFQLTLPESICRQDILTISPEVDGTYSWSPSFLFENPAAASQTIELQSSSSIICTVESEEGCVWSDTAGIIVNQLPLLQFYPQPLTSCSALEVIYTFDSTSADIGEMVWQIDGVGQFNGDTLNTVIESPGVYDLTATAISDAGCSVSLSFEALVEVYTSPVAQFFVTPSELSTIDPVATFTDSSVDAIHYNWNFAGLGTSDDPNPIFEFPSENQANFEVCLRVANQLGCFDSTCRFLNLDIKNILFVPNAFTPDNDGLNDIFLPQLQGFDETTYILQIFDRWGEMIFQTNDMNTPWIGDVIDGTHYAKDDVYHWQIMVKDKEKAEYQKFQGLITLIR
jgi:gliding motility-associated-like protein